MTGPLARYEDLVARGAIRPDPAQAEGARALQRVHDDLAAWEPPRFRLFGAAEPPRGLYLWGGVGTGKSLLMDLFFEGAPVPRGERRRVHFHAFCQDAQARIAAWRRMGEDERRQAPHRARRAPLDDPIPHVAKALFERSRLLCFDEFQVTDVADAMILSRLFEGLWARGAVVVATSNRVPGDLYRDGLNRPLFEPFIAELEARCAVLEVDGGTDYRLERLSRAGVYHSPLGPEAAAAVDAAWSELTVGGTPASRTFDVQGRAVTMPQAVGGAGRAGFGDLCRTALGPADYLAVADRFETLVLEGVPAMGPEDRNEAKRFVTLIDALYEHRCKLIVSAAAEPEGLYPAGDGSFEFSRTASRLHEMRSPDYLALPHRPGGEGPPGEGPGGEATTSSRGGSGPGG